MQSPLPIGRKVETFFPPGYDDREEAARPRFLLKPPSLLDRTRIGADMMAEGFRFASDADLRAELRRMVEGLSADIRETWLSCLDTAEAEMEAEGYEELTAEVAAGMAELSQLAMRYHAPYAGLVADRVAYNGALPFLMFRKFCFGWSGYATAFNRDMRGVSEDCIAELLTEGRRVTDDLRAAGGRVIAMLSPTREDVKNFAGPSRSPSARESSPAPQTPLTAAKAGSSTGASSPETPV